MAAGDGSRSISAGYVLGCDEPGCVESSPACVAGSIAVHMHDRVPTTMAHTVVQFIRQATAESGVDLEAGKAVGRDASRNCLEPSSTREKWDLAACLWTLEYFLESGCPEEPGRRHKIHTCTETGSESPAEAEELAENRLPHESSSRSRRRWESGIETETETETAASMLEAD